MRTPTDKEQAIRLKEEGAWRKWNAEQRPMRPTPEQSLEWLERWREFMFEIWRENPELRARYERFRALGKK